MRNFVELAFDDSVVNSKVAYERGKQHKLHRNRLLYLNAEGKNPHGSKWRLGFVAHVQNRYSLAERARLAQIDKNLRFECELERIAQTIGCFENGSGSAKHRCVAVLFRPSTITRNRNGLTDVL